MTIPAMFLVVGGFLNLAVALYLVVGLVRMTDADRRVVADEAWKRHQDQFTQQGITREEVAQLTELMGDAILWDMSIAIVLGLLAVAGGLRMRQLRSRGLAITAAGLIAIPCISPLGCLLLGEVIGIWCLVVLFSPDVVEAFRANESRPASDRSEGA